MSVFTQPLRHKRDVTWSQFLSGVKLVWIQSFPSLQMVTVTRLKSPIYRTIYASFISIMSRRHPGSPWPSLATCLYCLSLLVGLQGYILYRHRTVCIQVLTGRPAFARPCEGVHGSMSLMSSSPLLQQCPACLVSLTWIVFVMDGRWPYSCCFVGCCFQDFFNIARSILVYFCLAFST